MSLRYRPPDTTGPWTDAKLAAFEDVVQAVLHYYLYSQMLTAFSITDTDLLDARTQLGDLLTGQLLPALKAAG